MLKREPYIDLVLGPQAYHKINDTILNHQKKKDKEELEMINQKSKHNNLMRQLIKNLRHQGRNTTQFKKPSRPHWTLIIVAND